MDQHIFKQLNALERGARDDRLHARASRREERGTDTWTSRQPGWSDKETTHNFGRSAHRQAHEMQDEYAGQPIDIDSFDEEIPRRHAQLLVHPSVTDAQYNPGLSRFAFHDRQPDYSSSSPPPQHWLSSPTPRTIQRPEAVTHFAWASNVDFAAPAQYNDTRLQRRSSFMIEQMEAAERDRHREPVRSVVNEPPAHAEARTTFAPDPGHRSDTPVVRGIKLVSTREIPDSFRSIFPFPLFNVVQSRSFDTIYNCNDNFVLSSPTGSGKTAILELAICRLINTSPSGSYKIVYQAPTKSLCAERQRDWQAKFGPLDLQCAELTGDTEGGAQLRNVQNATIIITTPEKWDSMTRKWKDHQKLMLMVKLFLIDEVHILKEDRGATLEAVVSRMKSVESNVRFVALSATVPNSEDIASWLGQDQSHSWLPAAREVFGEDFRPVRLQKHVCGYTGTQNEFAFEKILTRKLTEVICKYSQRKPIMIFCFTRNSCAETAKLLAEWWTSRSSIDRHWNAPQKRVIVSDKDLKDTISTGVAFHHAGLRLEDRQAVEKAYLDGEINVICCTSTLAVGVNLPCHMVIVKHTVSYGGPGIGCKEYSDLEVMQMLGRAGRPQFDDSAIAVIMTRAQKTLHYEKMITGTEVLESCLHLNLIDHLNSEIGLGTITSASTAKKWLKGTFLYVRLKENPEHYKIDGSTAGRTLDERLENICRDGIAALEAHDLVQTKPKLHCTEFGDAMARYYLQFGTMKILLSLRPHSKVSEILSVISQATEFGDIRFRANEKPTYKELNKNSSIKFPIPVNLDSPAHKVSLIIQSVLGAVELPTEDAKQKNEYATARSLIFQHANRFIKCIIDCQLHIEDSITARNALMLSRSLGTQVWDDSPIHMKQLDAIGIVSVRKLAAAQIKSIEELENTEAHRIETVLSRNPPFGTQILANAKLFPKLRVSLKMMGEPVVKKGEHVMVRLKVEIGFLNEKVPAYFNKRPVYVCMLAERSDGQVVHFARASATKLNKGQEILISVNLLNASQSVRAYVMCDELAGTMRYAILKPDIPAGVFPPSKFAEETSKHPAVSRIPNKRANPSGGVDDCEEFGDAGIDDADLAFAEVGGFVNIDDFDDEYQTVANSNTKKRKTTTTSDVEPPEPRQLANGKWACNHVCKDKTSCKHMCCREGLDKQPKHRATKKEKMADAITDPKQTQLQMPASKEKQILRTTNANSIAPHSSRKSNLSEEARSLSRIHDSVKSSTSLVPMLSSTPFASSHNHDMDSKLSLLSKEKDDSLFEHGLDSWSSNDLPEVSSFVKLPSATRTSASTTQLAMVDDDYEILDLLGDSEWPRTYQKDNNLAHTGSDNDIATPYERFQPTTFPDKNSHGSKDKNAHEAKLNSPPFLHPTTSSSTPLASSPPKPSVPSSNDDSFSPRSLTTSVPLLGMPIPGSSSLISTPIVYEGYIPMDEAVDPDPDPNPVATLDDGHGSAPDALEEWFKQEFGTQLFNYVG